MSVACFGLVSTSSELMDVIRAGCALFEVLVGFLATATAFCGLYGGIGL